MGRLAADHLERAPGLAAARLRSIEDVEAVPDRRERVAQLVREHREELVLAAVRLLQAPVRLAERPLRLDAIHRHGDLIGDGLHERHVVFREARPRLRAEGQGPEQPSAGEERMAAVRLDPVRPDEIRAAIGRVQDVLGDDALPVSRHAAADGDAVVEPLDVACLGVRDARVGI